MFRNFFKQTIFLTLLAVGIGVYFPISVLAAEVSDNFASPTITSSTEPADAYYRARVVKIDAEGTKDVDGTPQDYQTLEVEILSGPEQGRRITIDHGALFAIAPYQKVRAGETVVISKPAAIGEGAKKDFYYIIDHYRLPALGALILIFLALAVFFGRIRGFTSIFGLAFTLWAIFGVMIPQIITGSSPLLVSVLGAFGISVVSLYVSHGFNRRTTLALVATLLCLALAVVVDLLFVRMAGLSGNGTEEAFYLQFGNANVNLKGILLGGIIIGVLGVLDDVTTGQTAAIEEIHQANPRLGFGELYRRGLSVGREHIASLINTLVLAYVGASFPLLLLFSTQKNQPLWLTLNSGFIAEEMVRTLVGSCILVVAVPLSTALGAYWFTRTIPPVEADLTQQPTLGEREQLVTQLFKQPAKK